VVIVRYADDFIVGFQHGHEAKAFLQDLQERLRKFELALHPGKTRLIRFGRLAAKERKVRGEGRPETFDFLGFTHFCSRSKRFGPFVIGRKTIKKRMVAKLRALKLQLRKRMHDSIAATGEWLNLLLKGRLNYFAVSGNSPSLEWFFNKVRWLWLRSLQRRSQRASLNGKKFTSLTCTRCRYIALTPEPKGGARCVSSARRELCGGRGEILVSTAIGCPPRLANSKRLLNLLMWSLPVRPAP
jgi:RNA-directed DNA polymerase